MDPKCVGEASSSKLFPTPKHNVIQVAAKRVGTSLTFLGSCKGPEFDGALEAANGLLESDRDEPTPVVVPVAAMVIDVYEGQETDDLFDGSPFGLTRLRDIHRICSARVRRTSLRAYELTSLRMRYTSFL